MYFLSIQIYIVLVARLSVGFLLNGPSNTTQNKGTGQCVTQEEFLDKNKFLRQETADLRHEMDKTFETLTAQLKQKLDAIANHVNSQEQINVTRLDELVTQNRALNIKYEILQNNTDVIMKENAALKQELSILKNTTTKCVTDLSELKSLKSIQPLQELSQMKQTVKTSSDKIHEIQSREQARSQDFVALYNMSLNTNVELNSIKQRAVDYEKNQTLALQDLHLMIADLNNDTRLLTRQVESNVSVLSGRIAANAEQVALLAYPTTTAKENGPIKFGKVGFSVGIQNLSTLKTDGKFTCEKAGLYLVTVSISSSEVYTNLHMYTNRGMIAASEISHDTLKRWASGTATVATALRPGDTVWVMCNNAKELDGYTFLSIVKIK